MVRYIRMARAKAGSDVRIILAALIGIIDMQLNGRACGHAIINARQDAYRIIFAPLGHVFVLPRLAPI
jgi:hypothetical protein